MDTSSAGFRTGLRAAVVTALTFLGALSTAIADNGITSQEWVLIASATVGALAAYLGIGAASGNVEPFFGSKLQPPPVPPEGDQAGH